MYTLDFTVSDWHEGLVANLDNPKIYGVNRENLSNQIRIYLDLEENVSYTLDFKSAGSKWYRLMAKGDGYLFYTLQAEDMKRRNFNIQLVATYADGQVKKTPIYKGYDILQSINATDSANDKDASSFKEALMELAKWTKGDKGDTGEQGPKGDKGDKGDTPVKGVDYFTDAEIAEIEAEAKADVDSLVTAEAEARANMDAAILENLATETSNREKADAALQSYVNGAIATEVQNRTTADSELSSKLTAETESREKADAELLTQISTIPKFSIEVVKTLPTTDISDTTVYLVKTSETETGNLYTEYIHVNGAWEELGTQTVDLSDYYQKEETQELLAKKAEKVHSHVVADISDYEPYDDTEVRGLISAESAARAEADAKKVGYQEVQGNTLYMYTDDSKAVLLATLELPTAPVQDVQVAGTSIVADGVADLSSVQQSYVDGVMCSTDKKLTTQQKINARSRIEAVGNSWELIESIELTANTTGDNITRSAFPDGTPYELAECFIQITYPKGIDSSGADGYGRFNFYNPEEELLQSLPSICDKSTSLSTATYAYIHANGGKLGLCRYTKAAKLGNSLGWNIYSGYGLVADFGNITAIKGTLKDTFPKGTIIDIYGIRA
jgi:hypothetical protein